MGSFSIPLSLHTPPDCAKYFKIFFTSVFSAMKIKVTCDSNSTMLVLQFDRCSGGLMNGDKENPKA